MTFWQRLISNLIGFIVAVFVAAVLSEFDSSVILLTAAIFIVVIIVDSILFCLINKR